MTASVPLRTVLLLLAASLALAGCASGDKRAYDSASVTRPLDVPPDLTAPKTDSAYPLPDLAPNAAQLRSTAGSGAQAGEQQQPADVPGVQLRHDGAVRWLEIQEPPAVVWTQAKQFLKKQGFDIALEAPKLGILETEWRASAQFGSGSFLTRLLQKGGSSSARDKYRIRIERGETPQQTRLYLTQRGMKEVASEGPATDGVDTTWVVRPSDPELEAEMLQRLLLFLGIPKQAASQQVATKTPQRGHLLEQDGRPLLQVDEGFARAWRLTELALDRVGVIVSDRDRDHGVYYIRIPDSYLQAQPKKKGGGFLGGLFSSGAAASDSEQRDFRVRVERAGQDSATVRLERKDGSPADPRFARRLLQQLQENLA